MQFFKKNTVRAPSLHDLAATPTQIKKSVGLQWWLVGIWHCCNMTSFSLAKVLTRLASFLTHHASLYAVNPHAVGTFVWFIHVGELAVFTQQASAGYGGTLQQQVPAFASLCQVKAAISSERRCMTWMQKHSWQESVCLRVVVGEAGRRAGGRARWAGGRAITMIVLYMTCVQSFWRIWKCCVVLCCVLPTCQDTPVAGTCRPQSCPDPDTLTEHQDHVRCTTAGRWCDEFETWDKSHQQWFTQCAC